MIKTLVIVWLGLIGNPEVECYKNCQISDSGLALIRNFEGYFPFPYRDPIGIWTVGYGHVILPHEQFESALLPEDANHLLRSDTRIASKGVNSAVRIPLKQHQADALISFTFNVGTGSLQRSTLLKKVNARQPAAQEFHKWVYAGGIKLRGLVLRRQAESLMYEG
jgi:GH24 family phage-related lysozyme (muramidase)